MAELPRAFRGHLNNSVGAPGINRLAEEVLEARSPEHTVLRQILLALSGNGKSVRVRECNAKPRLLKYRGDKLGGRGLALRTGDADDIEPARREAVIECT